MFILTLFYFPIETKSQTTYTYYLQGPFYYDGGVANANVSCAMLWVNGSTYRFQLNGTGVLYDTLIVTSDAPAYQLLWNSSSALNYTSIIDFQPTRNFYEVNLYIPSPAVPAYQYTFPVTDFANMTNPFLEAALSTDGSTYNLLEMYDLNAVGDPVFVFAQYGTYRLTFYCDQGIYSQMFTASTTYTNTLIVLAGAFPVTNTTSPTTYIQRLNSTLIGISYSDPSYDTDWFSVSINHRSGSDIIFDYADNFTSDSLTVLWNDADADKAYTVTAVASIDGTQYQWIMQADYANKTNPFVGIFDFLGQHVDTLPHVQSGWPEGMTSADIAQIIAAFIIMIFLCIGSFKSAGACCLLSWIIFGILAYMGWVGFVTPYALPEFVFSGFVGIVIMIDEHKPTVREW